MSDEVRVRHDHLRLLRAANWTWQEGDGFGSPGIDVKRPYGNSDMEDDMANVLQWTRHSLEPDDPDRGLPTSSRDRLRELHRELLDILPVLVSAGRFDPGTYRRGERGWRLVEHLNA